MDEDNKKKELYEVIHKRHDCFYVILPVIAFSTLMTCNYISNSDKALWVYVLCFFVSLLISSILMIYTILGGEMLDRHVIDSEIKSLEREGYEIFECASSDILCSKENGIIITPIKDFLKKRYIKITLVLVFAAFLFVVFYSFTPVS